MIKNIHCGQHWSSPWNAIGMDVKTWEPCDVHLGQVPRLQNDHGHPARCWLDKIYSIIRHLHLDQCGCLWKKVTWWHRETRSSPLPWLLSLSLLGVISLASERGQVSEEERSIPSNSTITSPTTSSLLYRSKERTTKCRVRICEEATVSTCFWTLWVFNRFEINFILPSANFLSLRYSLCNVHMSGILQKPAKLKAQSL